MKQKPLKQRLPDPHPSVDEDPFINAQMDAEKVSVGKPKTIGNNLDMVQVVPFFRGNFQGPAVKVYCVVRNDQYKIANIVYPGDPLENVSPWNLKEYLTKGLASAPPAYQGEDPATMLAIEEVLPGQWIFAGISSEPAGQTLAPPKKTLLNFTSDNRITRQDDSTASGTWTSGEGHLEWRFPGEAPTTFKVEKFGELEMTLKNIATGYFWVFRKL